MFGWCWRIRSGNHTTSLPKIGNQPIGNWKSTKIGNELDFFWESRKLVIGINQFFFKDSPSEKKLREGILSASHVCQSVSGWITGYWKCHTGNQCEAQVFLNWRSYWKLSFTNQTSWSLITLFSTSRFAKTMDRKHASKCRRVWVWKTVWNLWHHWVCSKK